MKAFGIASAYAERIWALGTPAVKRPISVTDEPPRLDFCFLRKEKSVFNIHAEIPDGILDLRVSKQDLDCPQIPGGSVNHRRFRSPK